MDPPWEQPIIGRLKDPRHSRADKLPYPTLSVDQLRTLPVDRMAEDNAHMWLWTTNAFLPDGLDLMEAWGFKYMMPIHWVKPSGFGMWWVHRTQTLLFGYRGKLDMRERSCIPTYVFASPKRNGHSTKPESSYELIEQVSHEARLEIFGRRTRPGWTTWGNEIDGQDIWDVAGTVDLSGRISPDATASRTFPKLQKQKGNP